MVNYSVMLMQRALNDLDEIYAYIAKTLQEPETALKQIDRLENSIESLNQLPYRCPERRRGMYANKGYRELFVDNYTVVFRVYEAKQTVLIVTVHYSFSQF